MSGQVAVAILRLFVTTDYGYSVRPTFEEQESLVAAYLGEGEKVAGGATHEVGVERTTPSVAGV